MNTLQKGFTLIELM
ncbi:prepilin-type N-terminal cleavage/methylation domain-containing protein [Neisseria meningitidis]